MNTFIIDIETIPQDLNMMSEPIRQQLLKYSETPEDTEHTKAQMALWAPTNQIVAIGVLEVKSGRGAVYYQDNGKKTIPFRDGNIVYRSGSEKEILERFWRVMLKSNQFVTFNGRSLDCPVLMLRSAFLGVRPSKNLMPYRYSSDIHIDLQEQLSFYHATKFFSLDMYCRSFGITMPNVGMTGHDMKSEYERGEHQRIARHCAGHLIGTKELYLKWKDLLAFF